MTVEEINIKITAEAAALKKEIDSVNSSLSQMKLLAQQAAQEAASAVSASASVNYDETEYGGTTAGEYTAPSFQKKTAPYSQTAQIPSLSGRETLIGAVSSGGGDSVQPIQINTTVEVDGDSIGQAAAAFNLRRNRITNGFSREGV